MTRITVTEHGRETVVTDIAPYRAERDRVLADLAEIFEGFEQGPISALAPREGEIVDLVNRHGFLSHAIESFEQAAIRNDNILAGWEIVKQNRPEDSA